MILKTKLFELEAVALHGPKPGLKVMCKNPGCTHRCILTFLTPNGFSFVSGAKLEGAFSSVCAELAKAGASLPSTFGQKSLM